MFSETNTTLLIIDDASENLRLLSELLQPTYRVLAATSGAAGLRIAGNPPKPDLILLDVMMPDMDGFEVITQLRNDPDTQDIPVIFLTAMTDTNDEERGLQLGAADYITKPISPPLVLARVNTQLEAKRARDWMKNQNTILEAEVAQRMKENNLIQRISIRALAHLAEIRDPETGNHILRTQGYVQRLATGLARHPHFAATLTESYIDMLAQSAPLHDIGKVGIPDHILLKPGKLTADEWAIMQTHAKLGSDAIEQAERDIKQADLDLDTHMVFLTSAKEIAHWHHEKWDGSGYPDGLAGNAIPVSARLMAVADVFDALISARPYKPAIPFKKARDIIAAERGKHFDPDLVDAFLEGFDDFVAIAKQYLDAALIAHPRWTN
ncbi:MAG: two-component system response regulator [Methylococcaceae bacterium]